MKLFSGRPSLVAALLALGGCGSPPSPAAPAARASRPPASILDDHDGPIVEVAQDLLTELPTLFSEDGSIMATGSASRCRAWRVDSGMYLGATKRGCEKLVPAVNDRIEDAPRPCERCGTAVASARDASGKHLVIARVEPSSLELWNLVTNQLEAHTELERSPAPGHLVLNGDVVHGVFAEDGEGGLYAWRPGHAPKFTPMYDTYGSDRIGAVLDPRGEFAIVKRVAMTRMASSSVSCHRLDSTYSNCGTFSEDSVGEPWTPSPSASSAWTVSGDGVSWVTQTTSCSYEGKLAGADYVAVLTGSDRIAVVRGTSQIVEPEQPETSAADSAESDAPGTGNVDDHGDSSQRCDPQLEPVHCFFERPSGKPTCVTSSDVGTRCPIAGVSAGGVFVADECDDDVTISPRGGAAILTRKGVRFGGWLAGDVALVTLPDGSEPAILDPSRKTAAAIPGTGRLMAKSADGRVVAVASNDAVLIVGVPSLEVKATLRVRAARQSSALSNDGKLFAVAADGAIETYAADSGARLARVVHNARGLVFRFDDAVLYAFDEKGVLAVDPRSGAERKDAAVHASRYMDPLGRLVALSSRSFQRVTDGASIWVESDGNAETDTGFWDGSSLTNRVFRLGSDPFTARYVTTSDLGEAFHHKGLVRAFLEGKALGDPRILKRLVRE